MFIITLCQSREVGMELLSFMLVSQLVSMVQVAPLGLKMKPQIMDDEASMT